MYRLVCEAVKLERSVVSECLIRVLRLFRHRRGELASWYMSDCRGMLSLHSAKVNDMTPFLWGPRATADSKFEGCGCMPFEKFLTSGVAGNFVLEDS